MKTFEELYGFKFGKRIMAKVYPDRESSDFSFEFTTPNNSEEDVRFFLNSTLWRLAGNIELSVWDGDEKLFSDNRSLSMFVNKDGVDPKPIRTSHLGTTKPRTTHLLPNKTYKLHVYRERHADNQPIGITYYGTDKNEVQYESMEEAFLTIGGVEYDLVKR